MRMLLVSLACLLLTGCVPPDGYVPKPNALKQSWALSIYEQGIGDRRTRNYTDAIACFTKAIEYDPEFTEAYLARGDAYTETREHKKALADLEKAFELSPDIANDRSSLFIHRDMAVCHTALEQWDKVVEDCNKMISLDGRYPFAFMARSIAYHALGKHDLAQKDENTYEALKHPLGK